MTRNEWRRRADAAGFLILAALIVFIIWTTFFR